MTLYVFLVKPKPSQLFWITFSLEFIKVIKIHFVVVSFLKFPIGYNDYLNYQLSEPHIVWTTPCTKEMRTTFTDSYLLILINWQVYKFSFVYPFWKGWFEHRSHDQSLFMSMYKQIRRLHLKIISKIYAKSWNSKGS